MAARKGRLIPLVELRLPEVTGVIPRDVRAFLTEADRRIDQFWRDFRIPAFVPCDFVRAYEVLRALSSENLTTGNQFCEWGSGFGVVTCLAAMLDFDACGIEGHDLEIDVIAELEPVIVSAHVFMARAERHIDAEAIADM